MIAGGAARLTDVLSELCLLWPCFEVVVGPDRLFSTDNEVSGEEVRELASDGCVDPARRDGFFVATAGKTSLAMLLLFRRLALATVPRIKLGVSEPALEGGLLLGETV